MHRVIVNTKYIESMLNLHAFNYLVRQKVIIMGEIFTGFSIPKNVNYNENQVISDLKRSAAQQNFKEASVGMQRVQSIFNENTTDFSSTENTFLAKSFEKAIAEKAYQSLGEDLSRLRFKEKVFNNTQNISENKFIKHEQALKMNPEIAGIENKIVENKSKIQTQQKALVKKPNANAVYQSMLKTSAFLTKKITQLQTSEFTLINDISSIKAQINDIKSGRISLADLQINITGSASSSAIDTASLIKTNSSSIAVVGGQQVSENKGFKSLLDDLKLNSQVSQTQEELESQIKKAIIENLEELLDQKENDLTQTKQQINVKYNKLDDNQKKVDIYEAENKGNSDDRVSIEQQLEDLIQENLDLVEERLKKDPQLIQFSSMTNFFNNVLKGSGGSGVGFTPDLEKAREKFSEKQENYDEKTVESGNYGEILSIKEFLKNEAKSSLDNSRLSTAQDKKNFENFKQNYGN